MKGRWILRLAAILAGCLYMCNATAMEPFRLVNRDTTYINEWFSMNIPKGWEYRDSVWGVPELEKKSASLEIYERFYGATWLTIVRSSFPMHWESPKQAAELSRALKEATPDEALKYGLHVDENYIGVGYEEDSLELGGLPAHCTLYEYRAEDEDTLLNFQFAVLNPEDNQLYYVSQYFYKSAIFYYPDIIKECTDMLFSIRFKRKDSEYMKEFAQ